MWNHLFVRALCFVSVSLLTLGGAPSRADWFRLDLVTEGIGADSDQCSLARLPSGQPAIAYTARWGGWPDYWAQVRFAWYDGSDWHTELVASDEGDGHYYWCPRMVVFPSGDAGVAYVWDFPGNPRVRQLWFAWQQDDTWYYELVSDPVLEDVWSDVGSLSMVVDADGEPTIVYTVTASGEGDRLRSAHRAGANSWQKSNVYSPPCYFADWNPYPSLASLPSGAPAAAFRAADLCVGDFWLYYADGTPPDPETVEFSNDSGWTGQANSLAVNSVGRPGISFEWYYWPTYEGGSKLAEFNGSSWEIADTPGGGTDDQRTKLVYLGNDQPVIAYYGALCWRECGTVWKTRELTYCPLCDFDMVRLSADEVGLCYDAYAYFVGHRFRSGDMNCSGAVNNSDIDGFLYVLYGTPPDYPEYHAVYPNCSWTLADMNCDGVVNNQDIDGFVACLFGNCP